MKHRVKSFILCAVLLCPGMMSTYSAELNFVELNNVKVLFCTTAYPNTPESLYQKGLSAKLSKKYSEALKCFYQAASMGHIEAHYEIGTMYQFGEGVSKNYAEALKWYYKPATNRNVLSQYLIGVLYYEGGWGLTQNYSEALKWFTQAASNGSAAAESLLGIMYENGYGIALDYDKALMYYRRAVLQDDGAAQYNLRRLEDRYTPQNGLKGEAGLAAEDAYQKGHEAYIKKNYTEALSQLSKAALAGHEDAQLDLGVMYGFGIGVKVNFDKSLEWYRKSAAQGNASAQGNIGVMYEKGEGVPLDYDEAIKWYQMAMKNGNPFAKDNIARVEQKKGLLEQNNVVVASHRDVATSGAVETTSTNKRNGVRPLGCYADSGVDEPDHAYDNILNNDPKQCRWIRPQKGNKNSNGWKCYICSYDWQQQISINVSFHPILKQWVASSQVGKYGVNNEWHIYVGENEKFWVFSNTTMILPSTANYTIRAGYDLYIAKDWTLIGLSHEPDVVYDQMVSGRKSMEILKQIKIVGKSPQMQINDRINAATNALRQQNQADIQRMINEADQKIDDINRQSIERYTSRKTNKSSSSTVRGIRYAPDYTGGQYSYWCEECKRWGPQHVHFDLK